MKAVGNKAGVTPVIEVARSPERPAEKVDPLEVRRTVGRVGHACELNGNAPWGSFQRSLVIRDPRIVEEKPPKKFSSCTYVIGE